MDHRSRAFQRVTAGWAERPRGRRAPPFGRQARVDAEAIPSHAEAETGTWGADGSRGGLCAEQGRRRRPSRRRRPGNGGSSTPMPNARLSDRRAARSPTADGRGRGDAHVRHATLPSPGDEPEFLDWISDFYSHRLDRGRPLWEIVLLDGLTGGRWALVSKTHHCLVDGVGSVDVVDLLLGAKPDAARAVSAPRAGVGLGVARMAPASTRACRPGGRRRPRGRSGRRARADASA